MALQHLRGGANVIGQWFFAEPLAASSAADEQETYDLVPHGPPAVVAGNIDNARRFTGSEYLDVAADAALRNLITNRACTVDLVCKSSLPSNYHGMFFIGQAGATELLGVYLLSTKVYVEWKSGGYRFLTSSAALTPNVYTLVTVTLEPGSAADQIVIKIWLNGALDSTSGDFPAPATPGSEVLNVGRAAPDSTYYFDGDICEARLRDDTLAAPAILESYERVIAGTAPMDPVSVAFSVQPSNVVRGSVMAPAVQAEVLDLNGDPITTSTATVAVAIGTNPGSATLGGTTSVAAVAGVATFANLTLDAAGVGYTLAVSSAGLAGDTSDAFTVSVPAVSTPDADVAARLVAQTPLGGVALVSGGNVFTGPVRPADVAEGPGYTPTQAIFCLGTGGPPQLPFLGTGDNLIEASVQVRIRSSPGAAAFSGGQALARAVLACLQQHIPTGYISFLVQDSHPNYLAQDEQGCHEWSVNVRCKYVA